MNFKNIWIKGYFYKLSFIKRNIKINFYKEFLFFFLKNDLFIIKEILICRKSFNFYFSHYLKLLNS